MRPLLDAFARGLARLLLRVFFREVEIVGAERLPANQPLVLVANHVNGLVDPLLLVAAVPQLPRFLAKSTLWKIWALRPILALGAVVPVYRRQDAGVDPAKNLETFGQCRAVLLGGGSLALFPEGISHDLPALQPLKSGAARIALEAESEARAGGRSLGVRIVPVGLAFDARESFRSRALVQIGPALDIAPEIDRHPVDPIGATAALTARIEAALAAVTLSHPTWEEARLVAAGADLVATDPETPTALPRQPGLAHSLDLRRAVAEALRRLERDHPERIAAAARAVRNYDRLLSVLGLRDEHLQATYPPRAVARVTARTLWRLLVALPVAALGTLLNWVPYFLVHLIARRTDEPNLTATLKLYPGLVLYPLSWAVAAWLAQHHAGSPWGIVTLVVAPLSGWVALLFHERRERFSDEARVYFLLRRRGEIIGELRARRAAVLAEIQALAAVDADSPDRQS
jgi:glycerol-3-phosphate O-acyltransferase / dihydroxyacetone phosphate acyltransferase